MENEVQGNEANAVVNPPKNSFDKESIMSFYKESLPKIVITVFKSPIDGIYEMLTQQSDKRYFNSLVLIATTAIAYILIPYIMMGEARSMMGGFGTTFKVGIAVVILLLIISAVAFGIKSVSGKPNFKNELLTGALCGIPLTVLLLFMAIVKLFIGESNISAFAYNPMQTVQSYGVIAGLVLLYMFLLMINILQQSFRAAGTSSSLSWYLSPVGILLSFYLAVKIGTALF